MPSLAELLGYIVQPLGGPVIPILPKAASNATGGSIPGVPGPRGQPLSSPSEMMNALTAIGNAQYENKLKAAQAEQATQLAGLFKTAVELGGAGPTYTTGGGISPAAPAAAGPAFGSIGGAAAAPALDFGVPGEYGVGQDVGTSGRLSIDQLVGLAKRAGFPEDKAVIMAAISMGESGGNPLAYNGTGKDDSYGVTQINAKAHGPIAREALNPLRAMELAFDISKGGEDFSPWSVYKSGEYKKYLPAGPPTQSPALAVALGNISLPAPASGIVPAGAPMSLAPAMTGAPQPQASGFPRLDDASLARARRMENIYGIIGKKMPTWAEEGVKMAPGGSMSPEYKGAIAATEAWAKVAPDLFTQTQLKQVQAGLDLTLKEKQAILDRASDEQKQRLADELKNRSEGRTFDRAIGAFVPVPGFNEVTAGTRAAGTAAEEAAKTPEIAARDRFNAILRSVENANRNIELSPGQRSFINPVRVPFPPLPGAIGPQAAAAPGVAVPVAPVRTAEAVVAPEVAIAAAAPPLAPPASAAEAVLEGANPATIELGKGISEGVAKEIATRRPVALDAVRSIQGSDTARRLLDSGMFTGMGAGLMLNLGRAMSLTGMSNGETVANTQAFIASRAAETGRLIKNFGSGTGLSDADREFALKMSGGDISFDEKSIRDILRINDAVSREFLHTYNKDASKIDELKLSPFPMSVPMPAERAAASGTAPSGSTSTGVKWRLE